LTLTQAVIILTTVTLGAAACEFAAVSFLARSNKAQSQWAIAVALAVYVTLLITRPASLVASNLAVFAVSAVAAVFLGRGLRAERAIVAFSIAASIGDIVSFTLGPTRRLLRDAARGTGSLLSYLTLSIPLGKQVVPVIGIGDLLILGVLFVALGQIGTAAQIRFAVPTAGLLIALGVGLIAGGAFGIPFMASAVVVYFYARRKRDREGRHRRRLPDPPR
jgi:hypothetical protein